MGIVLLFALEIVSAYTYFQSVRANDELSDRIIRQTATLIDQRVETLLFRAESQSALVAGLVAPSYRVGPMRNFTASGFEQLALALVELTKVNPEFGSVSFTLESTGESVSVRQQESGTLTIEVNLLESGRPVRRDYVPFGDRLEYISGGPGWMRDTRDADYYQRAKSNLTRVWTPTYVLRDFSGPSVPGVTCAHPVVTSNGRFVGLVTVDFTLTGLSRFLQGIKVGNAGYAFLVEFDENQNPRVIAHPEPNRLLVTESGSQRLVKYSELGDPVLVSFIEALPGYAQIPKDGVVRQTLDVRGQSILAGYRPLAEVDRPRWLTCVVVPAAEFVETTRQTLFFLTTVGLVALGVGIIVAMLLAQRVAKPLHELADEAGRIQALDLVPRAMPKTKIAEVDDLSEAIDRMKTSLRSFEKLVPSEYARWLIASGQEAKLGGERRNITTYFADIIGFTSLSHHLSPEDLVKVLTEYLDIMSDEVLCADGTIDKFNGDDVMAFWGAPTAITDHAVRACRCAIRTRKRVDALHEDWKDGDHPLLRASFGISTGDVVVGNVGSRQRMNYTVIGDAVNVASRLQGLNKYYGTEILISERTRAEAGEAILARHIDTVFVFGRDESTVVFELIAMTDEATDDDLQLAHIHSEAMTAYAARDWDSAEKSLRRLMERHPDDGPARVLLERIAEFRTTPPPDSWDGSYHMRLK